MLTVRLVRGADIPEQVLVRQRAALLRENSPRAALQPDYRSWLMAVAGRDEAAHWVAEVDGQVVGSLSVTRWAWAPGDKPGGRGAFVYGVYVEPEWRRLGVAARLLQAAHQWATEDGIDSLTLIASPLAGDLYHKHGYRPVSRWMLAQLVAVLCWCVWSSRLVSLDIGARRTNGERP